MFSTTQAKRIFFCWGSNSSLAKRRSPQSGKQKLVGLPLADLWLASVVFALFVSLIPTKGGTVAMTFAVGPNSGGHQNSAGIAVRVFLKKLELPEDGRLPFNFCFN